MKKGNAKLVLIGLLAFTALAWLGLLKNQIDSSSAYRKYLEQGQRYEEKGIYIDALESYEKALELNSGSYDITMKLADMYYQVGDYKGFLACCDKAIELAPKDPQAYLKKADYYMEKADYSEAMEVVKSAAKVKDNEDIQALSKKLSTTCIEKYSSYETVGDWHVQPDRNYVTVSEEGRYGMAAKDGTRKIKCTYEYLGAYDKDTGVIPCCLEGSYYYIDVKGNKKLVGDNTYQYLGSFGNGLAPAQRDGKYGYIDTEFHEQMFELDYAGAFANGVAAVKKGDKWALINCKLKNITDFTYDEILVDSYGYCSMFDRITVRTGDKYFFVDHDGKQIGATYDGAAMVAANDGYAAVKVGSQWGFADAKGELVIQPQYENARSFSLGLAPVEENDRWGYINTDGELVVEEKYFDAGVFSPDGAACVKSVAAWSFLVLCEYDS